VKAVLFDAVGTLFGVRGSVGEIYSAIARTFGVISDPEAIEKHFRKAFAARRPPKADARSWWRSVVAQTFTDTDFPDFEAYFDRVWHHFATAEPWFVYPETVSVLAGLRSRSLVLAVVSNFDERLYPVLEALELRGYFQVVAISTEVGHAKPDPRLFAHALQRLGCSADGAIHIGDSTEDVIGAKAAGIRVRKVDRSGAAGADTIDSLARLLEMDYF
jgi:putative hydrolase of the HAD superfamily